MSERRVVDPEEVAERLNQQDVVDEVFYAALDGDLQQIVINFPERENIKSKVIPAILEAEDNSSIADTPIIDQRTSLLERVDDLLVDFGDGILDTGRQFRDRLPDIRVNRRGAVGAGVVATLASSVIASPAVAAEHVVVSDESGTEIEKVDSEESPQEFVVSFNEDKKAPNSNSQGHGREERPETIIQDESGITDSGDTSTEGATVSNYVSVESSSSDEKLEETKQAAESEDSAIKVNFNNKSESAEEATISNEEVAEKRNDESSPEELETKPGQEIVIIGDDPIEEDITIQPDSVVAPETPVAESIQVSFPEEIPTEKVPEMDKPENKVITPLPEETTIATAEVPSVPNTSKMIVVKKGQTLNEIARANNTSAKELGILNDIEDINLILIGQKINLPGVAEKITVKEGQTLGEIASNYGVGVEAIVTENNIVDRNLILAGQELNIPTAQSEEESIAQQASTTEVTPPEPSVTVEQPEPRLSENFIDVLEKGPLMDSVEAFAEYKWDTNGDGSPDHPLLNDIWNNWDRSNLAQALFELGNAGWIDYDKGVELVLSDIVQSEGYSYRYGNDGDDFDKDDAIDMNRNLLRTLVVSAVLLPKDKLYIANLTDGGHIGDSNHFTDKRDGESKYGLGNAVDFGHSGQTEWLNYIGDGLVLNQDTIGGFRELILGHPDFNNQINHGKRYTPSTKVTAGHSGNNLHGHLSFLRVLTDDPETNAEADNISEPVVEVATEEEKVEPAPQETIAPREAQDLEPNELYKAKSTQELISLGFTSLDRIPEADKEKFDSILDSIPTIQYAIENHNSRQGDDWGPKVPATAILAIAYDLGLRGDDLLDTVTTLSGESGFSPFVIGDDKGNRVDGMVTRLAVGLGQFFESDKDGFDDSELAVKQKLLHPVVAVAQVIEWKERRGLSPWYFYQHRDPEGAWGGHYDRVENAAESISLTS